MLQQAKNLAQKLRLPGFSENMERRCAEFESRQFVSTEFYRYYYQTKLIQGKQTPINV